MLKLSINSVSSSSMLSLHEDHNELTDLQRPFHDGQIDNRSLHTNIFEIGRGLNISNDVVVGLYSYLMKKRLNASYPDFNTMMLLFLREFQTITQNQTSYKARSFKYLTDSKDFEEICNQILFNTREMVGLMGHDFFDKNRPNWHAPIEGTSFKLTCEGGSGSGAYSMDLTIAKDDHRVWGGKIWKTGLDFEDDGGLCVRIIRSGGVVKRDRVKGKTRELAEFREETGVSPGRILAFLSMYIAYELGAKKLKALTTCGAKRLSTLRSSKGQFSYDSLFTGVGFETAGVSDCWMEIPDFQNNFYPTLGTDRNDQLGLRAYETDVLDRTIDSFNNLGTIMTDEDFSISLCRSGTNLDLRQAIETFSRIYGKSDSVRG